MTDNTLDPLVDVDVDLIECLKLGPDFFPDCWKDDKRMNVLFAPFRAKQINPQNYESKLKFWRNLVTKYCDVKGSANVTVSELRCAFKRNGCRPHSLATVFDELKQTKDIQSTEDFFQMPATTWTGWAFDIVKKPIQWSISSIKNRILTPDLKEPEWIILDIVKKHSDKLQTKFGNNQVITIEELLNNLDDTGLLPDGARIALHYLVVKKNAAVETINCNNKTQTLIKIAEPNREVREITQIDRSLYELNILETALIKLIDKLESDVNRVEDTVRTYIRENKKQLAKNYLRKRNILQKQLEQKTNTLSNIQQLLEQFNNTEQNINVIGAYKMGSDTLKKLMQDSGVTLDVIDDLTTDMKETLEVNDEIQMALGSQMNTSVTNDEQLEEELNELLVEEKANNADEQIERRLRQLNIDNFDSLPVTPQSSRIQTPAI